MFTLLLSIYCKIAEWFQRWAAKTFITILKGGTVPKHVAFIMDGNRRFAVKKGLGDRRLGHFYGYNRFERVLDWCFQLGIKCVTVYAFSVENFKRTKEEVTTLMELAVEKLAKLAAHSEIIKRNKVGIRIIGELDLLPESVMAVAMKAMAATAKNDNYLLNICFPYVSRMEMERARSAYNSLVSDPTYAETPEECLYRSCLDTFDSPDIDILVRTSGEWRLSEFMLHQLCESPNCYYAFSKVMWPDFTLLEFGKVLLKYQRKFGRSQKSNEGLSFIPERLKAKRLKEMAELLAKHYSGTDDMIGR